MQGINIVQTNLLLVSDINKENTASNDNMILFEWYECH